MQPLDRPIAPQIREQAAERIVTNDLAVTVDTEQQDSGRRVADDVAK